MKKLIAGGAAVVSTAVAATQAHAGVIADVITGANTTITDMQTDIATNMGPVYVGILAAVGGLLLLGGMIRRALR